MKDKNKLDIKRQNILLNTDSNNSNNTTLNVLCAKQCMYVCEYIMYARVYVWVCVFYIYMNVFYV